MVMFLSSYHQFDEYTFKPAGTVSLSNQAVIGKFEIPSPGLYSQRNSVSSVFRLRSSSVNLLVKQVKSVSFVFWLTSSFVNSLLKHQKRVSAVFRLTSSDVY